MHAHPPTSLSHHIFFFRNEKKLGRFSIRNMLSAGILIIFLWRIQVCRGERKRWLFTTPSTSLCPQYFRRRRRTNISLPFPNSILYLFECMQNHIILKNQPQFSRMNQKNLFSLFQFDGLLFSHTRYIAFFSFLLREIITQQQFPGNRDNSPPPRK